MRLFVACLCFSALPALSFSAMAQTSEGDDIVRLPVQGQGQMKEERLNAPYRDSKPPKRLIPGGGLMVSFDSNGDGRISLTELRDGSAAAFLKADANGDGYLTALEQQAWAASLPTHDDSLANPARFDPNLDRMVSFDEFNDVISKFASDYAEEGTGEIILANLKAKDQRPERREKPENNGDRPRRPQRQ